MKKYNAEQIKLSMRQLYITGGLVMFVFVVGIVGYKIMGEGKWSLLDCAYMTVISLTTVGYGETIDISTNPVARIFTMILILSGMGTSLLFISNLTAFIVEGQLSNLLITKKMMKRIGAMENHIIVCGAGETGYQVCKELYLTKKKFIVIDTNEERCLMVHNDFKADYVLGNASDDEFLYAAGIERAFGIIISLNNDKDNLFITVSAKQINPRLKIVVKSITEQAKKKLSKAGAHYIVTPNHIGGMRMASEMIRPAVVTFLDTMLKDTESQMRIDEVEMRGESKFIGKRLNELDIRKKLHATVVAIMRADGRYDYNPAPDMIIETGMKLIVLGEVSSISAMQKEAGSLQVASK